MTKLQKKFATAIATGALLFNTALPVFADYTVVISGNGSDSDNEVEVEVEQSTTVVQSNNADIYNEVHADADTGGNDAEGNTGGDVKIDTGDAETTVDVKNEANSNVASVDCCQAGDVDVLIEGNGEGSDNEVEVEVNDSWKKDTGISVFQSNVAEIDNKVYADADTGDNEAEDNTGGDVEIKTGSATVGVTLSTSANANSARVGGGSDGESTLSARIIGNGSDSDNEIEIELEKELAVVQSNFADIYNKVSADADTGDNDAEDNTGGSVLIDTGDAEATVDIDNMVNFNWADVDCGCLFDVLAKIAGNGEDSDNEIELELEDELAVFQGNCDDLGLDAQTNHGREECEVDNKVWADADTGDNEAEDNTGDPGDDPTVETGDATVDVDLENTGNANVYGEKPEWELPEWLGGFSINITLDLSDLLDLLGLA